MPCLVLTGYPCAGKTRVAELIRSHAIATTSVRSVIIINEESSCQGLTPQECYATAAAEKKTRGALKASFDRAVHEQHQNRNSQTDTLLILDSSNYIKGFRYELYCISKAAGEKHGVVWIATEASQCLEWNSRRNKDNGTNQDTLVSTESRYDPALLSALVQRYEPPDERNRWDNPCYRLEIGTNSAASAALENSVYDMHKLSAVLQQPTSGKSTDATPTATAHCNSNPSKPARKSAFRRKVPIETTTTSSSTAIPSTGTSTSTKPVAQKETESMKEEEPVSKCTSMEEQIDRMLQLFLVQVQPLRQGLSTRSHISTDANCLHLLDTVTQRVCSSLATAEADATEMVFEGNSTFTIPKNASIQQLSRYRRLFLQWSQQHPPDDLTARGVAQAFLDYLAVQTTTV